MLSFYIRNRCNAAKIWFQKLVKVQEQLLSLKSIFLPISYFKTKIKPNEKKNRKLSNQNYYYYDFVIISVFISRNENRRILYPMPTRCSFFRRFEAIFRLQFPFQYQMKGGWHVTKNRAHTAFDNLKSNDQATCYLIYNNFRSTFDRL